MWSNFQNGVFHTHPIYQRWQSITSDWKQQFPWNLDSNEYQHRLVDIENFRFVCALKPKIQSSKFIELDVHVCGRPGLDPFCANLVTYLVDFQQHICNTLAITTSTCVETSDMPSRSTQWLIMVVHICEFHTVKWSTNLY